MSKLIVPELPSDEELEEIDDHVKGAENLTFEQMIGAEYVGPIVRDLAKPYRDACLVLLEALERIEGNNRSLNTHYQSIATEAITKARNVFENE